MKRPSSNDFTLSGSFSAVSFLHFKAGFINNLQTLRQLQLLETAVYKGFLADIFQILRKPDGFRLLHVRF